MMKKITTLLTMFILLVPHATAAEGTYFGGKRVLVAYFSWGGNTQRLAEEIQRITGADLFRIEPVTPYPTDYTECTQVALAERDSDARPAIARAVEAWDDYDIVFIGCPVWWHTAPMIISTFTESYDFKGKTVVPFCTYASTYRDETLQEIVDLTPDAAHLTGLGTRSGQTNGVEAWLDTINKAWEENTHTTGIAKTVASAKQAGVVIRDLSGRIVNRDNVAHRVYIISKNGQSRKVMK